MNNHKKSNDKLKLKPGFGEFYGGNQIHITRVNKKQQEKQKYRAFEGKGESIDIMDRKYKHTVNNIKKPLEQKRIKEKENNEFCFCISILFFFYLCYLLHLMNQKLYYYTGYKF